jgi:hypothetical protein
VLCYSALPLGRWGDDRPATWLHGAEHDDQAAALLTQRVLAFLG